MAWNCSLTSTSRSDSRWAHCSFARRTGRRVRLHSSPRGTSPLTATRWSIRVAAGRTAPAGPSSPSVQTSMTEPTRWPGCATRSGSAGRFALWGASYLGYTAWALMMDPPPELAAAVIAISAYDNYAVTHGTGAFALDQTLCL